MAAQSPAFVCNTTGFTAPPAAILDFGQAYTGEIYFSTQGSETFTGILQHRGFFCRNAQPVPVEFTFVDISGDGSSFRAWGYCLNGLCVDGTAPRTIAPGEFVLIPVVFVPTKPGSHTATLQVRNASGFAVTVLTITGSAVTPTPIPTLKPTGLVAMAAALMAAGLAFLRRS